MTDKMREEFEAAYRAACLKRPIPRFDPAVFAKDHCDDYVNPLVQSAIWGWQSSRESLVVDLPKSYELFGGSVSATVMYPDEVRAAIESLGLKVKP